jgi:hypothetical protein
VAAGPSSVVLPIEAPMHEPVWSGHDGALVGLTPDAEVERVDPSPDAGRVGSAVSARLPDVGRNIAAGMPDAGVVYVPRPGRNQVTVLRVSDLRPAGALRVGPAPAYLALDEGADRLLALSADGRTVTGVDLEHRDRTSSQRVDASPAADIDGPKRERVIEFHVTGADGIEHYLAGARRGRLGLPVTDAVGDEIKVTRLYVAESGTDDLVAVESGRASGGLDVVGRADLGAPVEFVGDDARRVYAATHDRLVILETRSYGGFPDRRIPVLKSVDFRADLPGAVRSAPLSGLAVGPDRVYLTFAGQPYVLSLSKPNV